MAESNEPKKSFIIYNDYAVHFQLLTNAEIGQLIRAMVNYSQTGEIERLSGALEMAFSFIRLQMDRDREKWEKTKKRRSEAGKKGGEKSALTRKSSIDPFLDY